MLTVAVRLPGAVGVNETTIVQVLPAATELPQVFVSAKSPALVPVTVRLVMLKLALPVLVRTTAWPVLVVPTLSLGKDKAEVERLTAGTVPAPVPMPVKLTVWGLLAALSVKVKVAVRLPAMVGVKVTLTVQLLSAATELPQVLVSSKSPASVPVMAMLLRASAALPELLRVTDCAEPVVPTPWLPKDKEVGERLTPGAATVTGVEPHTPPVHAVRVTEPAATAKAVPELLPSLLTVSTVALEEPQVTEASCCVLLLLNAPVAMKGRAPPRGMVALLGAREMETRLAGVKVSGSYSSAVAKELPLEFTPPLTSTAPVMRSVAV